MPPDRAWWEQAHPDDLQGCPRDLLHLQAYVRQLRHAMRVAADLLQSPKDWATLRANADAARVLLERALTEPVWATHPHPPPPTTPVPAEELAQAVALPGPKKGS